MAAAAAMAGTAFLSVLLADAAPAPAAAPQTGSKGVARGVVWVRQVALPGTDFAFDAASDGKGGVVITGTVEGALPGQVSAGNRDAFVRRYDASGKALWTRQFGSQLSDMAYAVAVDAEGNVYVVGFVGDVLPGQQSATAGDAFVRKYDATGKELWTRQFGSAPPFQVGTDEARALAIDADGAVYVAGWTADTLRGQTSAGGEDAFVRKFDASGKEIWTRQFGTKGNDRVNDVVVAGNSSGDIFVAASVDGNILHEENDAATYRLDGGEGKVRWFQRFGGKRNDEALGVAPAPAGGVYVAASVEGIPFRGHDASLRRLDAGGKQLWERRIHTGDDDDQARGVHTEADGVLLVGWTLGTLPGQKREGFGHDAFVRRYSADGKEGAALQFGTDSSDDAYALAPGPGGSVYVVGTTEGRFPGQQGGGPFSDAFVARVAAPR
jgi:hypothetical protein